MLSYVTIPPSFPLPPPYREGWDITLTFLWCSLGILGWYEEINWFNVCLPHPIIRNHTARQSTKLSHAEEGVLWIGGVKGRYTKRLTIPMLRDSRPSLKKDVTENKEINGWIEKYLGVGEWVMDQSVAIAGSSSFFERKRWFRSPLPIAERKNKQLECAKGGYLGRRRVIGVEIPRSFGRSDEGHICLRVVV